MERITHQLPGLRQSQQGVWQRLVTFVLRADAGFRQRHALGKLDGHLRRDVGLDDTTQARWTPPGMMR